jgi:hypothetical protein
LKDVSKNLSDDSKVLEIAVGVAADKRKALNVVVDNVVVVAVVEAGGDSLKRCCNCFGQEDRN